MEHKHLAVGGVFTLAVGGLAAVAIALSGGSAAEKPDAVPAGQVVEEVPSSTVPPTSAVPVVEDARPVEAPVPADDGDTGPVNTPVPADQLPDIAPGNPAGDNEQRPDPAPAPPAIEQPVDVPSEVNQPPTQDAPPAAG